MAIFVLPALLLVAAVVLGVMASTRPGAGPEPGDSGPLALAPVDSPGATSPPCRTLLGSLPASLPANPDPLQRRQLAAPAPSGATAWGPSSATHPPVVLRCGLPRPVELRPDSQLFEIDKVSWLVQPGPDRDTFVAVDRPVYVALTVPRGLGTGPVQAVSDVIGTTLPASG